MAISEDAVRHVAKLAKLSVPDDQLAPFTKQMSAIMDMVAQLNELDTTGVALTTHGFQTTNVLRENVPETGMSRELLFENVKTAKDGLIQVPAIIDNGEGGA